jgi:hypothetical protein
MTSVEQSQQRMSALEEANFIRFARSNLKRDLHAGNVKAADLISNPPEYIHTMKLFQLLMATPGIGKNKARRIIRDIPVDKTIGTLTQRQRDAIVFRVKTVTFKL